MPFFPLDYQCGEVTDLERHELFVNYCAYDFGQNCIHFRESARFRNEVVVYAIKVFIDLAECRIGGSESGEYFCAYICHQKRDVLNEIQNEVGICEHLAHEDIDMCIWDLLSYMVMFDDSEHSVKSQGIDYSIPAHYGFL